MRKFILTSSKIQGQIEVIFKEDVLQSIDYFKADMNLAQRDYFLKNFPVRFVDMEDFLKGTKFTCVEADYEVTFDMFWDKYKMKVDKKRSKKVWDKLSKSKKVKAFFGIEKYDRYLKYQPWRNKMEPKTYLTNERWEDEW